MSQPRFPTVFRIESIWFWREQELDPIARELAGRVGLTDLVRDYEDTWEWVDISRGDGSSFNLSRMHNWQSGVYSDPVITSLRNAPKRDEAALRAFAEAAKRTFGCRVFAGEIGHTKDGEVKIYDSIEV